MRLAKIIHLLNRRSKNGQSIIILAFALVVMIGFVGITTDVALLFVRYNSLRRAVDSAAIAAAGQLRESTNYLTLNSIAKEYIQLHGIDPSSVKVETCESNVADFLTVPSQLAAAQTLATAETITLGQAATKILATNTDALCTVPPKKLVRVSAQFLSSTAFLSLLGFTAITLQANSVSQTASLDVVLAIDTSLSMAEDTKGHESTVGPLVEYYHEVYGNDPAYAEFNNAVALGNFPDFTNRQPETLTEARVPGVLSGNSTTVWGLGVGTGASPANGQSPANSINFDDENQTGLTAFPAASVVIQDDGDGYVRHNSTVINGLADETSAIRWECWYSPFISAGSTIRNKANYGWAGCCNDPTIQSDDASGATTFDPISNPAAYNSDPNWYVYDDGTFIESVIMTHGYNPLVDSSAAGNVHGKKAAAKIVSSGRDPDSTRNQSKFATGDGNYSDLMCRPFKDVRDAARRFIRRLDFPRGDRIVLVTFDSEPRQIVPYTQTVPIISDATVAVQTLNMKVGVEVSPNNYQSGCHTSGNPAGDDWGRNPTDMRYYPGANPGGAVNYWTLVQCVDTNTGGGIATATSSIVDPRWIRRESVWVMVLLSDGYPNRTPPLASTGIGNTERSWAYTSDNPLKPGNLADTAVPAAELDQLTNATIAKYCKATLADDVTENPDYGTKPQYCAAISSLNFGWGWKNTDRLLGTYGSIASVTDPIYNVAAPQYSFGFCPTWTYCQASGNPACGPDGVNPNVSSYFYNSSTGAAAAPLCVSNDPDARHFCMNQDGSINQADDATLTTDNTLPTTDDYQCDPQYDPMDYARDRIDYAALLDYTNKQKGQFIATYAIFFNHNTSSQLRSDILGVKFMRYVADAGDNGIIDNPIQRWYRDQRDGLICEGTGCTPKGVNPPPTGGFRQAFTQGIGGQDMLPNWSATNDYWKDPKYGYDTTADPCAQYDYFYSPDGSTDIFLPETDPDYLVRAKTQCGQYYFATDASGLRRAFIEIAGRLFTRLTR